MAALSTLQATTLAAPVSSSDSSVTLASGTGVRPGLSLYFDRELVTVVSCGIGTACNVLRGQGGTASKPHVMGTPVTIGRGDQFYDTNPAGAAIGALVTPWINVLTGEQWTIQGDESGPNAAPWWALTQYTHGTGALGVRTDVAAPSVVTVT